MKAIPFVEQSVTLNENHEDGFIPLPVQKGTFGDGSPFFVSKWEPDKDERTAIANGAPIYLVLWSRFHPPVRIQVDRPSELGPEPANG